MHNISKQEKKENMKIFSPGGGGDKAQFVLQMTVKISPSSSHFITLGLRKRICQ